VHKKDIVRASVMLERAPEFAVALCFDVEVDKEAEALAKDVGLRIFRGAFGLPMYSRSGLTSICS
jgi:translation initiation factor 5B